MCANVYENFNCINIILVQKLKDHRCQKQGCGEVFVIDGNMKNHRAVCLAKEAGYAQYQGLPGKIRTGCPNTPDLKSRFCSKHKPTVVTPQSDQSELEQSEGLQGIIIGKKTTRQTTLYEVVKTVCMYVCVYRHAI